MKVEPVASIQCPKNSLAGRIKDLVVHYLTKYQILNFMIVGGIGYVVNMAIYYPLTLVFDKEVTFLGSHFYLPPFLISTYVAMTVNYLMNRAWTFKNNKEYSQGYLRYLTSCSTTVIGDIGLLFVLVDFGHLHPMVAAALAILVMFITRYSIVKRFVWKPKK